MMIKIGGQMLQTECKNWSVQQQPTKKSVNKRESNTKAL